MDLFNEYALLIAVATPVVAIVGIQAYLFLNGERDTLLLPGVGDYPAVAFDKTNATIVNIPVGAKPAVPAPSNDFAERKAA